jgi:hypothetical protein
MLSFLLKVAFMLNRKGVSIHGLNRPPQVRILLDYQGYEQTGGQAASDEAAPGVLIFVLFIQFSYVDLRDNLTGFLKFLDTVNWGFVVKGTRRLTDPSFLNTSVHAS